jgi:ABC-type uncharacterized transport system involved in gliding motility auxiliary subunit
MDTSFRSGLILIGGIALLIAAAIANSLSVHSQIIPTILLLAGGAMTLYALVALRADLRELLRHNRGEQLLTTTGMIGVLVGLIWISALYPARLDMTEEKHFSLAPQTIAMLKTIDKPVNIIFFHDRGMRETVELYEQFASRNSRISVTFYDPIMNPAQAKLHGVQFAGTALFESEGRKLTVNGPTETEIANGILRVTQSKQQKACFLDGHGEPDPFSFESHDHMEDDAGHAHGVETKIVQHEQHGMAKARMGLEAMNYVVEKISLMQSKASLAECAVLIVAGPQSPLMQGEVRAIDKFLEDGGNAFFLLEPFVTTGLESVLTKFGIVAEPTMVIDEASHFWADPSSPAVTEYNRHEITARLPLSFFPGVRPLTPTAIAPAGVSVRPLVNTSKKSFANPNKSRIQFSSGETVVGSQTIMVSANFNPNTVESAEILLRQLRGEKDIPEATTLNTTRKAARLIVAGDADFATNSFYHILGNGTLFLNAVNYLSARENLIGLEPRTHDLPYVSMTNTQMKATFILSIILVPLLMAAIGVAVWWRRR